MELRSSTERKYHNLQSSLTNLGLYEEGMKYDEMNQIMQALQASAVECETKYFEQDMERALKESEMEFTQSCDETRCSTMISNSLTDHNSNVLLRSNSMHSHGNASFSSPFSSPDMSAQQLLVHAEVHHTNDWSPLAHTAELDERLQRKRFSNLFEVGRTVDVENVDYDVKRLKSPISASSPLHGCSDSGIHSNYGDSMETLQLNGNYAGRDDKDIHAESSI